MRFLRSVSLAITAARCWAKRKLEPTIQLLSASELGRYEIVLLSTGKLRQGINRTISGSLVIVACRVVYMGREFESSIADSPY